MKIIHCADLHLGSKLNSTYKNQEISNYKLEELRRAFNAMVDRAKKENIKVIMLCGDVFDKDKPTQKDKALFYTVVSANKDIDFLYLKGNHDSEISTEDKYPNLKTFTNEWTSYEYEDVVISGIELSKDNQVSLYNDLSLDRTKTNIVMMHGQESATPGVCDIVISKLKGRGIDYLALGHIHKGSVKELEGNVEYVYPGCLIGRGFDECGEKGYYILDVDNKTIKKEYVVASKSIIYDEKIDVSGAENANDVKDAIISKLTATKNDIVRVTLEGNVKYNDSTIESTLQTMLDGTYKYFVVEDKTIPYVDFDDYKEQLSIRGEFVRKILSNNVYSDDDKKKLIALGLRVLDGRGIE